MMGYQIDGKNGKAKHWGFALDEGYDPDPHVALMIAINCKRSQWNLPLSKDTQELASIANMLRHVADRIDNVRCKYASRRSWSLL
jgi:hypothetical protein